MELKGIYGDQLWKTLKLSMPMVDAIRDGRWGVRPNTEAALVARGLWNEAGKRTELGEHVRDHLEIEGGCDWVECMPAAHEAMASEDHPVAPDMITEAVPEIQLPAIAGHRWQRHTLPGEAVTEHSTYQAVVATSHCLVSGHVSYQARTGTWIATGRRNGMSAMVSANSWGGVTLPEALEALAANVAENEANRVARVADTVRDLLDGSEAAEARMSARLAESLARNPFPAPTVKPADLYPAPMEAGDFDRMNADMERADIRSEEAAEAAAEAEYMAEVEPWVEFEAMLAELFPGDDDPRTTYAEREDELSAERERCEWCKLSTPCAEHASVEAWVRAGIVEDNEAIERMDALALAVIEVATPWKATTSKHKRAHKRR